MRIAFDSFMFDSELRVLAREGTPVHITPKAFSLLELLLQRHPRPVAATEILEVVWPGCFVGRGSLANLILEVRAALGDRGRTSKYIRTVHRYGYAFCGVASPTAAVERPRRVAARARLVTPDGQVPLDEGETLLGRSTECRVVIHCPSVSRAHARIVVASGEASIEDLHSKNGTFVNGIRLVGTTGLADGDQIRLASVPLMYRVVRAESSTTTLSLQDLVAAVESPAAVAGG